MTYLDALRLVWTVVTGSGCLIMLFLLREVVLDQQAIASTARTVHEATRIYAVGEVIDQIVRMISLSLLFLAGLLSYAQQSEWVITCLIASAFAQVLIGLLKLQRHKAILDRIRLFH